MFTGKMPPEVEISFMLDHFQNTDYLWNIHAKEIMTKPLNMILAQFLPAV